MVPVLVPTRRVDATALSLVLALVLSSRTRAHATAHVAALQCGATLVPDTDLYGHDVLINGHMIGELPGQPFPWRHLNTSARNKSSPNPNLSCWRRCNPHLHGQQC